MRMMRMMRATWADMNGTSASPTRVLRGDSRASGIGNRDWKSASRTCLVETSGGADQRYLDHHLEGDWAGSHSELVALDHP